MLTFLNSQIGLLIGVITVIGLIWGPKAWPSFYSWVSRVWDSITYPIRGTERKVLTLTTIVEDLKLQHTDMSKKLDFIIEQFYPNGGATLKDSLNRIETKQLINEVMVHYVANATDMPMFKTDHKGHFTWASQEYLKLTGKTIEDILGWGWILTIHPEDEKQVRDDWNLAIEEQRAFQGQYRIIDTKGKITNVSGRATPSIFNGKIIAWVGMWEILNGS